MEITFNIQNLLDLGITPNQYLVLYFLDNYNADLLSKYLTKVKPFAKADLDILKEKGLVVIPSEGKFGLKDIEITDKFRKLAAGKAGAQFLDVGVDGKINFHRQVYDLFPDHIKTGTYKVKSNFPEFSRRMHQFEKKYPIISKSIILKATERYVAKLKTQGYKYMKLAKFFVYKGQLTDSVLYAECEEYIESLNDNSKEDGKPKHGERLV